MYIETHQLPDDMPKYIVGDSLPSISWGENFPVQYGQGELSLPPDYQYGQVFPLEAPVSVPIHMPGTHLSAPKRRIFFVSHGGCTDGFGAAWSFYRSLKLHPPTEPTEVTFIPETHRWIRTKELLRMNLSDVEVIYGDICPEREDCVALHQKAKKFSVYDHHVSAQRKCGDLPYCFFDMARSGAGIMWDTFCKTKRPKLIEVVEAGDLWKKERVPNFEEIAIILGGVRKIFPEWDKFAEQLETDPNSIIRKGKSYVEYRNIVEKMLLGRKVHKLTIAGITMPAVNAGIFQSKLGNILTEKVGPCAAVYYFTGSFYAFSLRSNEKGPDVSKIAEKFGGGGHPAAAGFKVDRLEDLKLTSLDGISEYTEDEMDEIEFVLDSNLDSTEMLTLYFG